jgi:hypothetical protein
MSTASRYPLSAIRYPLSAIRYPLSAIRYPLSASGRGQYFVREHNNKVQMQRNIMHAPKALQSSRLILINVLSACNCCSLRSMLRGLSNKYAHINQGSLKCTADRGPDTSNILGIQQQHDTSCIRRLPA